MEKEDKELLLKELCARLPYKVKVEIISYTDETSRPWFGELSCKDLDCFIHDVAYKSIKPYLRPMSSMTEEENKRFDDILTKMYYHEKSTLGDISDYLNSIHVDYRRLIEKGLAIEVTEQNNPYKD